MQPSEVDNLSTYEMRNYVSFTRERLSVESDNKSSIFSSLAKILGFSSKK